MAMRIYSREDFFKELSSRAGLEPTDAKTDTHTIWKARDGQLIPIPFVEDHVPDCILDAVLNKLGQLYECEHPTLSKPYIVTESADIVPLKPAQKA